MEQRICCAVEPLDGYLCSRPLGHEGEHVAMGGGVEWARWSDPVEPVAVTVDNLGQLAHLVAFHGWDPSWVLGSGFTVAELWADHNHGHTLKDHHRFVVEHRHETTGLYPWTRRAEA